jgi:hypothetical protein
LHFIKWPNIIIAAATYSDDVDFYKLYTTIGGGKGFSLGDKYQKMGLGRFWE